MKRLIMNAYKTFECIGGKCPNTCCAGWKIYIDPQSAEKYQNTEGEFGERLKRCIMHLDNGRDLFVLGKDRRCPFLDNKNLCQIYLTLGPDALCVTCRDYPRMIYQAGDIEFAALSISCPEVGRIILTESEKQQFIYLEDECVPEEQDVDWIKFNEYIRFFTTINNILQERQFYVRERLAAALIYCCQGQELINSKKSIDQITQVFENPDIYCTVTAQVLKDQRAIAEKLRFIKVYIEVLSEKEQLFLSLFNVTKLSECIGKQTNTEEIWHEAFNKYDEAVGETEQEQLLVYLIFRHFMDKYSKQTIWESMIFVVAFYTACRCMAVMHYIGEGKFPDLEWRTLMISNVSRHFEHGGYTWGKIKERLKAEKMDQLAFWLQLVN